MADEKVRLPMCAGGHCKGKNPAEAPHGCPFQEEIHNSTDQECCTCCDDCRQECLWDI